MFILSLVPDQKSPMPHLEAPRPATVIDDVRDVLTHPVAPADFPKSILRYRNQRWAEGVGLGGLSDDDWVKHFARFEPLEGNLPEPLALAYHGHQFGNYNPDIGDGRGFLFAQLEDGYGRVLDLATKGSGQTPWSRFGDGRLTLKGGVREILAANMLEALGVYTSKPFSLIETGEELARNDEPSPTRSSVLVRLSHSHIRFGSFQRLAYLDDKTGMATLIQHSARRYWPHIEAGSAEDIAPHLLRAVMRATADMIASWMLAGFVHGVMNTDNMTITGESFDYGPWRFIQKSDPNFTAAYFDSEGRYRFGMQPGTGLWNIARLAECLAVVCEPAPLEAVLSEYQTVYGEAFKKHLFRRLGIAPSGDDQADIDFAASLMTWMTDSGARWEQFFFDWFCGAASSKRASKSPQADMYNQSGFAALKERLEGFSPVQADRLDHVFFEDAAPPTLIIEELEALWDGISQSDDWSEFSRKISKIDQARTAYRFGAEARWCKEAGINV